MNIALLSAFTSTVYVHHLSILEYFFRLKRKTNAAVEEWNFAESWLTSRIYNSKKSGVYCARKAEAGEAGVGIALRHLGSECVGVDSLVERIFVPNCDLYYLSVDTHCSFPSNCVTRRDRKKSFKQKVSWWFTGAKELLDFSQWLSAVLQSVQLLLADWNRLFDYNKKCHEAAGIPGGQLSNMVLQLQDRRDLCGLRILQLIASFSAVRTFKPIIHETDSERDEEYITKQQNRLQ